MKGCEIIEKYKIIGETFRNKNGFEFIVEDLESITSNSIRLYRVRFLKSGYIAHNISSGHIRNGEVKDYFSPSVFGVGCLGYASGYAKRNESRRLYYTWRNMIRRCYDKNYRAYKWYGAIGVTVCDRWKRLDYFIDDVKNIPGYDPVKFENNEIELDKDILGNGMKLYSPETCCFVSHFENNQDALKRRWHPETNIAAIKCNDYPRGVAYQ